MISNPPSSSHGTSRLRRCCQHLSPPNSFAATARVTAITATVIVMTSSYGCSRTVPRFYRCRRRRFALTSKPKVLQYRWTIC
jgi:hypothetical protein